MNVFPNTHGAKWTRSFRRKLLAWFDEHQRDLPWRKNKTPYRIWVSEIMLQQTQVATVVDYYRRFIKRFPTVQKLAAADESDVLKFWEGLGYYRRARQMHAAAQAIVQHHGGRFPTDFDEVLALPGVGRYTAGAILSISMDQRQPILEGNTIRLFARLLAMKSNPRSAANQKQLWAFSESLLPVKRCGDLNQALMELGSEICHPKRPQCLICPVQSLCPTLAQGLQEQIPVSPPKTKYESLHEAVIVVQRGNRFLIRQCGPGERWEGLWDFPRFAIEPKSNPTENARMLAKLLKSKTGLVTNVVPTKTRIKHAVTRFRITLDCFYADEINGRLKRTSDLKWVSIAELNAAPMSATGRKIAQRLPLAHDPNGSP